MNDLYYQEIEPKMLFWSQFMDLKKKNDIQEMSSYGSRSYGSD